MALDGRNVKVEELNERRIEAVRLRLSGLSVAKTAKKTKLSEPTVIAAVKAYKDGGWPAVPVAPRGRGVKRREDLPAASSIKHLSEATPAYSRLASLTHLQRLEAETIHIMREVAAEAANPVMLYSIGKDSSVMLHIAQKAFYPGKPPFPLLHVDTTWKFKDMYAFRDRTAAELGMELIVHVNPDGKQMDINP